MSRNSWLLMIGIISLSVSIQVDDEQKWRLICYGLIGILLSVYSRLVVDHSVRHAYAGTPIKHHDLKRDGRGQEGRISVLYSIGNEPSSYPSIAHEAKSNGVTIESLQERIEQLEQQNKQQQIVLERLIHVVTHPHDFDDLVRDYRKWLFEESELLLDSPVTVKTRASELLRHIHTFKGSFNQMGLVRISFQLHQLENQISHLLRMEEPSEMELRSVMQSIDLNDCLLTDVKELEIMLGSAFFERKEHLTIHVSRIEELRERIVNLLPPYETRIIGEALDRLTHRPFQSLFSMYPAYVNQLAERLGKKINPCVIVGSDFPVDSKIYVDFSRSLVHLFRNVIDHGIESPQERLSAGKEERGTVRCEIRRVDEDIELLIWDDGRGIDVQQVKKKCHENQLFLAEQLDQMSESELLECIFLDGFSTKTEITELSGRGIGLATVREEVMKLGGHITVKSRPGQGTEFIIVLPSPTPFILETMGMSDLLEPTIEAAISLLDGSFGIKVTSFECHESQQLDLHGVTSLLHIRGMVDGMFVFSVDSNVAQHMVRAYVMDELSEEEMGEYKPDVVGECSNLIMGGISQMKSGQEEWLRMATPITSVDIESVLRYSYGQMWAARLDTNVGQVYLGFVVLNH